MIDLALVQEIVVALLIFGGAAFCLIAGIGVHEFSQGGFQFHEPFLNRARGRLLDDEFKGRRVDKALEPRRRLQ